MIWGREVPRNDTGTSSQTNWLRTAAWCMTPFRHQANTTIESGVTGLPLRGQWPFDGLQCSCIRVKAPVGLVDPVDLIRIPLFVDVRGS